MPTRVHSPDQYMLDLRQLLAHGTKHIGILLGAGSPTAVRVDTSTGQLASDGDRLIPSMAELTTQVVNALDKDERKLLKELHGGDLSETDLESCLSRLRNLGEVLGTHTLLERDGHVYEALANTICAKIGQVVSVDLPVAPTPFSEMAGWIGGTARDYPVELFTTNYDLLLETAFERARVPYFDGFSGAKRPFFDAATIELADLPNRWARLWKIHGSLGWEVDEEGRVYRSGNTSATQLIYPTHLKYDQMQKRPYSALLARLRSFLNGPDTILLTCGFSFFDAHITSIIDDCLSANRATNVFAIMFGTREEESAACALARNRANMSVYARDGGVINCISAQWALGLPPTAEWGAVRELFWDASSEPGQFTLGDFNVFARFVASTRASHAEPATHDEKGEENHTNDEH